MLLFLLSSARGVRAMASANQSLQSYFFQKEFFRELIVFRHLNMDFVIFFNVILSDLSILSVSRQKHNCEVKNMVTQTLTRTALSACYNNKNLSYCYIDCFDNVIK